MVRRRSIVRRVLGRIHGTSSSDEDTRPAPEPRAQANPDVAPDAAKGPSVEGIGRTGLEVQALAGEIASRQGGLAGSDPRSMLVGARPRYGLSKGVSRLMRAGEAILRRGSLAVSRWEKVPADFGPDREPPTWLEPRPRDAAQPSEVSAAALSTPAHAPVSSADRPNAGQGVSPKAEHRRTAAGRIRRRTGRPGISRRIATSVDRPVVSKIGRAVARIPIEPMVPRDRWTPREMEIERPSGDDPSEGSGPSRLEARPVRHGLATEPLGAPASRTASVETRGPTALEPGLSPLGPERQPAVERARRPDRPSSIEAPPRSGGAGSFSARDACWRGGGNGYWGLRPSRPAILNPRTRRVEPEPRPVTPAPRWTRTRSLNLKCESGSAVCFRGSKRPNDRLVGLVRTSGGPWPSPLARRQPSGKRSSLRRRRFRGVPRGGPRWSPLRDPRLKSARSKALGPKQEASSRPSASGTRRRPWAVRPARTRPPKSGRVGSSSAPDACWRGGRIGYSGLRLCRPAIPSP